MSKCQEGEPRASQGLFKDRQENPTVTLLGADWTHTRVQSGASDRTPPASHSAPRRPFSNLIVATNTRPHKPMNGRASTQDRT
jgi:hypothetical protein